MKIKKLTINNFRQFFGEHSLTFSLDSKKNITVVHGENGGGKTALLNAFKWGLYQETDFDTGDANLLNRQALSKADEGEELTLSVKIEFEHDGANYEAIRAQKFIKAGTSEKKVGAANLSLSWTTPEDGFKQAQNPEMRIKQILPHNLHTYFFFHGERIERLASVEGTDQVRKAIKNLMGIEVVERACAHLDGGVKKHFKSELKKFSSPKDAKLLQDIEVLDGDIDKYKKEIDDLNESIAEAKTDIGIIDKKIEANKETEELQGQRKQIEDDINFYKSQLANLSAENKKLIGTKGFLAFFQDPAEKVHSLLEEKRHKGELPYKVKKQFIEDLLQEGECICGNDLSQGSEARSKVEAFKKSAGSADLEEGYMLTTGAISNTQDDWKSLQDQLKGNIKQAAEFRSKIETLREKLDEISGKLGQSQDEEVSSLEARRKELNKSIESWHAAIGKNQSKMEECVENRKDKRKQYEEEAQKTDKANAAARKDELVTACREALQRVIESFSNEIREKLSVRVKETVDSIMRNAYIAKIDEKYALKFYQKTPAGEVEVPDLSSGQKVVASLSFIASIINVAKQRYQSDGAHEYFSGGLYPLVMDTPFGNADDDHSSNIARYIPSLADQVVIFASNKNWSDEVDEICRGRIGKEYSLIHFSPDPKDGVDPTYERTSSTGYEYSQLEEGHYGR